MPSGKGWSKVGSVYQPGLPAATALNGACDWLLISRCTNWPPAEWPNRYTFWPSVISAAIRSRTTLPTSA